MQIGCYTLDLYCDCTDVQSDTNDSSNASTTHVFREFPHQFTAELGSSCRKQAIRAGWVLHRDGTTTCPKCVIRKGLRKPRQS